MFLSTHYRKPMDWTEKKRQEAESTLLGWKQLIDEERDEVARILKGVKPPARILEAVADDLNTPLAITRLHALGKKAKQNLVAKAELAGALMFLGFDYEDDWSVSFGYSLGKILSDPLQLEEYENYLQKARDIAMKTKDFSEVDRIKNSLLAAGVEVRMSETEVTLDMTKEFDPSKLEALK